ncbi:MAG: HupE/UreJ family protein [Candidatus Sedimenticola sp. PURPLELP]
MKQNVIRMASLAATLVSGPALAHVGSHGSEGLLQGLVHMLADHGYLLALLGAGAAAVVLKRSMDS